MPTQIIKDTKALSINRAWQGRRFKTGDYKAFEEEMLYKLKPMKLDFEQKYNIKLSLEFRLNSFTFKSSDVDNYLKPLLDILQKAEIIEDDKHIVELVANKIKVKKSEGDSIVIDIEQIK